MFGVLLAADVAYGFGWLAPYRPPRAPYLGAVIAVAGLVRLPAGPVRIAPARATEAPRVPGPRELPFSQLVELDRNRPDDPRGMRIMGLVAAALLLAGFLSMRRAEANRPASG